MPDRILIDSNLSAAHSRASVNPESSSVATGSPLARGRADRANFGLETLAATIGEDAQTIEDVYEPYLLQQGFLQRTPRGRMITQYAKTHFGYEEE